MQDFEAMCVQPSQPEAVAMEGICSSDGSFSSEGAASRDTDESSRCNTKAKARWLKSYLAARVLTAIRSRLAVSVSLREEDALHAACREIEPQPRLALLSPSPDSITRHGHYLRRLRDGVKRQMALSSSEREAKMREAQATARAEAEASLAEGRAHDTVQDEEELHALARWQQGDSSLYSTAKLSERMKLRTHPTVTAALHRFWEAALASGTLTHTGSVGEATLDFAGYAALLTRVYRILLDDFDAEDAATAITEDWRRDSDGRGSLSRVQLSNSLFELADTVSVRSQEPALKRISHPRDTHYPALTSHVHVPPELLLATPLAAAARNLTTCHRVCSSHARPPPLSTCSAATALTTITTATTAPAPPTFPSPSRAVDQWHSSNRVRRLPRCSLRQGEHSRCRCGRSAAFVGVESGGGVYIRREFCRGGGGSSRRRGGGSSLRN